MEVIMKYTRKSRYFSALLSMTLLLPCLLAPTAAAEQDFYPDATYDATAASELDGMGKWKYRELLPKEGTEKASGSIGAVEYKNTSGNYVSVDKDTDTKKTGAYSWHAQPHTNSGSIRFQIDGFQKGDYYFSAWMKAETTKGEIVKNGSGAQNYVLYNTYNYPDVDKTMGPDSKNPSGSSFYLTGTDWNRVTLVRSVTGMGGGVTETDSSKTHYFRVGINGLANDTWHFYLDDCSFRFKPEDNVCIAYTKSATTTEKAIAATDEVCFTFSNDIDYATVTKENVLLNGAAYDDTEISWTVNETTRENKLSIKFGVLSPEKEYTVELSGITDAWGRAIVGTKKTTIKTLPAVERTNISFAGESGEVSSLSAGDLTASLKLKSNVGAVKANIIAAECDGNKIVKIVSLPVTLSATETEYTLPKLTVGSADHSVRVFVWSDGDFPVQYTKYGTFSSTGWKDAEY